jgi:hypothetical protein
MTAAETGGDGVGQQAFFAVVRVHECPHADTVSVLPAAVSAVVGMDRVAVAMAVAARAANMILIPRNLPRVGVVRGVSCKLWSRAHM